MIIKRFLYFFIIINKEITYQMHKILVLTAALAAFANARTSGGQCTDPQLQPNFDATKYTGVWFNAARDKQSVFENGNCE
jgi:apolipoprotein D and lipocalin family protein